MAGAVIIGVGPGIGKSVAQRFSREGMPVALIARSQHTLDNASAGLKTTGAQVLALTADVKDETSLRNALDQAATELGTPEVLVYNAAVIQADSVGELSTNAHLDAWSINVVGAITAASHIAPAMVKQGGGSFIITGGMPEPKPEYVSLSLGKAGVRTLVKLLDKQYGSDGIHVATVTVAGYVSPGTAFDPDDIAEHYWYLHTQPQDQWDWEIVYSGRVEA